MENSLLAPMGVTLPAPVLIVEDEPLVQKRLLSVLSQLGYEAEALIFIDTLADALRCIEEQPVAMALVDIGLPDGSGENFIRHLRQQDPAVSILVISAWSTAEVIISALKAGATGYVLKERDNIEISLSIRSILRGGAPIDPFVAKKILDVWPAEPATATASPEKTSNTALSARERQILNQVADGLSNREIAEYLHLSKYTVECHIKHIYRKLQVSSRTKAVNEARSRGWLN